MQKKYFLLFLLVLSIALSVKTEQTIEQIVDQIQTSTQDKEIEQEIDLKRLNEINEVIKQFFKECKMQQQSQVLYNCSISTSQYAQFIYKIFHKQLLRSFLHYYRSQGLFQTQTQIAQLYETGQKIHQMTLNAYNQWISVYKPNKRVEVEQMYGDLIQMDDEVLDIIEHKMNQYKDFVGVLKNIYKIENGPRKYVNMGNKSQQQISSDMNGIYEIYYGQCRPITNCTLSIEAFVYFIKQVSFYITPLTENNNQIFVSEQMDFKATQFLIEEVEKLRTQLGEEIQYELVKKYSYDLALNLIAYLKQGKGSNESEKDKSLQGQQQQTKTQIHYDMNQKKANENYKASQQVEL